MPQLYFLAANTAPYNRQYEKSYKLSSLHVLAVGQKSKALSYGTINHSCAVGIVFPSSMRTDEIILDASWLRLASHLYSFNKHFQLCEACGSEQHASRAWFIGPFKDRDPRAQA